MKLGLSLWIMALLLLAITLVASLLPIYPDEVAYKIFLERYFINGGFKQTVTPYPFHLTSNPLMPI